MYTYIHVYMYTCVFVNVFDSFDLSVLWCKVCNAKTRGESLQAPWMVPPKCIRMHSLYLMHLMLCACPKALPSCCMLKVLKGTAVQACKSKNNS